MTITINLWGLFLSLLWYCLGQVLLLLALSCLMHASKLHQVYMQHSMENECIVSKRILVRKRLIMLLYFAVMIGAIFGAIFAIQKALF